MDKFTIYHYTSDSKLHSKQWILPDETAPNMAKTTLSANNVMAGTLITWEMIKISPVITTQVY